MKMEKYKSIDMDKLLTDYLGPKDIINKAKNYAISKGFQYIRDYFGFEYTTMEYNIFKDIADYFTSVSGVEIISNDIKHKSSLFPNVSICKLIKLDTRTYVYLNWCAYDDSKDTYYSGYIYVFGKKSYHHYKYAYDNFISFKSQKSTAIYTVYADKESWSGIKQNIDSRSFNTLYFDNNIEEKIKTHLDTWIANKDTYKSRGIIFKTGILLHGAPGTGKSSIAAVADYMDCDMIVIDPATFKDLNITEVTASINGENRTYVILLDDIDVILKSRDDDGVTTDDKATISKLLSFLDSSNSPNNAIFIATTNHIELFDKAITRSGRFDKIIEIGNIHKDTAYRMCKGFGLSESDTIKVLSEEFKNSEEINPADLQAKILSIIKTNINKEV